MLASEQDDIVLKSEQEYERGLGSGPFGMREVRCGPLRFNPVVSLLGFGVLWGFVLYVSIGDTEETKANFKEAQSWVTATFTWLYIASQDYWLLFLILRFPLVYYYGDVKLGKDDEEPEYSDISYFAMVFCAGVAIGLIFYGASEPLYHLKGGPNRYNGNGYSNENQMLQDALNVTLFHWGLQAWIVYAITAITMGFLAYRKGLPLCLRSTMAPLFGKATWGWFGDLLDVLTIATIVAGLCTSLGLGASQIVAGMMRLGVVDAGLDEDGITNTKIWVVVVITLCATLSVVLGLDYGIKTVSQIAFILGNFLLIVVFTLDEPWYLLNLMVQTVGYHFQHLIEISFYTDAFAQLGPGQGGANDGKGAAAAWMDWWTIFYWGWWISWAPFVGTFMARISRGRTIKVVVAYTLTVPFFYATVWFCVFGGAALRMNRRAEYLQKAGSVVSNDPAQYVADDLGYRPDITAGTCYDVPASINHEDFATYSANTKVSPVCRFTYGDAQGYWFDLMNQYHGMGTFLSWVSVITTILYFVTSSDSGSLVVDLVASNGQHCHVTQRVLWALSEGAVAVALLKAGGSDALTSLQAISIVMGLPYTFVLMLMCSSLWRALKIDAGHMPSRAMRTDWRLPLYGGICDIFEVIMSLGRAPLPSSSALRDFFLGLFVPPLVLWQAMKGAAAYEKTPESTAQKVAWVAAFAVFFLAWIIFFCVEVAFSGLFAYGWFCYVAFVSIIAVIRHNLRQLYKIEGSGPEDFFAALFFYPQVLAQMAAQVQEAPKMQSATFPPEVQVAEAKGATEYAEEVGI